MKCFRFIFLIIPFLFSCNESKTTVKGGIKPIPYKDRILVAVGTIENKTGDTSHNATLENATGIFISELDSTECFRLIERQRIKTILEEQKLGISGIIDPSKTKEVGKLLGADAILFASLSEVYRIVDERKAGVAIKKNEKITVVMDARLVNVETGEILSSSKVSLVYENEYASIGELKKGNEMDFQTVVKEKIEEAAKKLAYEIALKYSQRF